MQKKHVLVGVLALVVVFTAASMAGNAGRSSLKETVKGPSQRSLIPTNLPPVTKLPQQISFEKATQVLSFDDGSCEAGLGVTTSGGAIGTATAWTEFDVPTQCVMGGLQLVQATGRVNTAPTSGAFQEARLGQAGAAPPAAGGGANVGLSSPFNAEGACPGNAVSMRGVAGTVTGTSNFWFGLRANAFFARDTNSAPAGRIWLGCAACGLTTYAPGTLSGAGFGGNWILRVTVEDTDCIPTELEGACCTSETECLVISAGDCSAQGGLFQGAGVECDVDPAAQCESLYVTLHSTSAVPTADGGVAISWTTEQEVDTAGFRVLREDTIGSGREKSVRFTIVAAWVAANGSSLEGSSYEVIDGSPEASRATKYILQDVDNFGKVTEHDPIMVDRGSREARGRRAAR